MRNPFWARYAILSILAFVSGCSSESRGDDRGGDGATAVELLNVSYDPTRELYEEFNAEFARHWLEQTGRG